MRSGYIFMQHNLFCSNSRPLKSHESIRPCHWISYYVLGRSSCVLWWLWRVSQRLFLWLGRGPAPDSAWWLWKWLWGRQPNCLLQLLADLQVGVILSFTESLISWSCHSQCPWCLDPVVHIVLDVKTSCHSHCPWCEDILSFTLSLMSRHPVIHSVPDILVQSFTVSLMSWSSHSKCPWCQDILSLTLSLMSRHNVIHIFLDVKTSCHSHCTWCQDILSFT